MIGNSLSRYELDEELGQGGMSTVYRGEDTALGRTVAVKVLHEHLAKKPDNRERFRREARAIASLSHPNILDVYDFSSEDDERSFIVMEYIPGHNLREFVDEFGAPPPEVAALICIEIAKALEHAHEHGIIHRDLKPENVMISDEGEIKLMDFGIAHVIDAETMTKTGSLLGSPAHMAPELIDSGKVDERADIFSLGTVLYLLTTGELPFCGSNAPQVLRAVMECRYDEPELVNPKVGHRIGQIVERALHKDPDERYQTVPAVRRDLLAAVHEVGIEDTDDELADYFADPEGYAEAFDDRIISALSQCGRRAIEKKRVPEAMGFFNRVLAYDPDNEEVQDALAKLNRDQRLLRAGRVAAIVALLAASAGAVWWFMPRPDPAELSVEEAANSVNDGLEDARENATVSSSISEARRVLDTSYAESEHDARAVTNATHILEQAQLVAEKHRSKRLSVVSSKPMPNRRFLNAKSEPVDAKSNKEDPGTADDTSEKAAETVTYKFLVKPQSARLYINGEEHGLMTASVNGIELEVGKRYRVKAKAGACEPLTKTILARKNAPDKPIPMFLDYRNGGVSVTSNRAAVIYVDDSKDPTHKIGRSGGKATIDVDFGKASLDKSRKKVKIRVARADNFDISRTHTVEVTPGKLKELNVQLP
ncbi:MAG: protein kinase domain-containing protein [Myxococcota bacterium]